jgi:hypothetical protein
MQLDRFFNRIHELSNKSEAIRSEAIIVCPESIVVIYGKQEFSIEDVKHR